MHVSQVRVWPPEVPHLLCKTWTVGICFPSLTRYSLMLQLGGPLSQLIQATMSPFKRLGNVSKVSCSRKQVREHAHTQQANPSATVTSTH